MATTSTNDPATHPIDADESLRSIGVAHLRSGVDAASLWATVALPFLYLPLAMNGMATYAELFAFVCLLGCNLGTLGYVYRVRSSRRE